MDKKPEVGIGVIVIKDNKVLLGKRKGSHGGAHGASQEGILNLMKAWKIVQKERF